MSNDPTPVRERNTIDVPGVTLVDTDNSNAWYSYAVGAAGYMAREGEANSISWAVVIEDSVPTTTTFKGCAQIRLSSGYHTVRYINRFLPTT